MEMIAMNRKCCYDAENYAASFCILNFWWEIDLTTQWLTSAFGKLVLTVVLNNNILVLEFLKLFENGKGQHENYHISIFPSSYLYRYTKKMTSQQICIRYTHLFCKMWLNIMVYMRFSTSSLHQRWSVSTLHHVW